LIDLLAAIFLAYNYGKIDTCRFNRHRSMKAETSRQIPQMFAASLEFVLLPRDECNNKNMTKVMSVHCN